MTVSNRLKEARENNKLSLGRLSELTGIAKSTLQRYETGTTKKIPMDAIPVIEKALGVKSGYLMGWDTPSQDDMFDSEDITYFEIIGTVRAGYNGNAVETHTGETAPIPTSFLKGRDKDEFFVLQVKGDSMYPKLLDGDLVLVQRCTSVDSGATAVILYNGDEATVKKVRYVTGEDWFEMIPANPEYKTKRIEGKELKNCRVLGKVIKLIRDI